MYLQSTKNYIIIVYSLSLPHFTFNCTFFFRRRLYSVGRTMALHKYLTHLRREWEYASSYFDLGRLPRKNCWKRKAAEEWGHRAKKAKSVRVSWWRWMMMAKMAKNKLWRLKKVRRTTTGHKKGSRSSSSRRTIVWTQVGKDKKHVRPQFRSVKWPEWRIYSTNNNNKTLIIEPLLLVLGISSSAAITFPRFSNHHRLVTF